MNNKCKILIVLSLVFMVASFQVQAEKFKGTFMKKSPKSGVSCFPPAKTTELALNNVRALLKTNGNMWFLENAEYEVPKGSGKTSMFSAALWIGGQDDWGGIYVAAMRFGQIGNDYWTGPLVMKNASIDPVTCAQYDKFYKMTRLEVERHIRAFAEDDPTYDPPKSILEWPAHPTNANTGQSWFLAPFYSVTGDQNNYRPREGDYPYYDLGNELCPWTPVNKEKAKICTWVDEKGNCDPKAKNFNPAALDIPRERFWTQRAEDYGWDNMMIYADHVLKGDETIFWFLNDKGGSHTESGSTNSIGLEIRVQAFAFATNDELNKMTFYSYEIINRGSITLSNTFFSQWVDPDLGYAWDDYVGCDVNRGLGYCYNGKEIDGSGESWAYGENPPAVGVDFFQGPYIDADGADNPKFHKDSADINSNNMVLVEYCKRFVHYIHERFNENDENLYEKFYEVQINGKVDTIRWNDQFAINGVNFGDGIVDNERFGMRRFVYHNNNGSVTGDPATAIEYYQMLQGMWKDSKRMKYGGNAYETSSIECDFMFPRGTDFCNWGTKGVDPGEMYGHGGKTGNWSEENPKGVGSSPNEPDDRRFMQSAGPFKLKQGACNYITVGIPWAKATQGGRDASIALLMVADDKCQALFENCFKLLDGPDAPILTIREYDQKLICLLSNHPASNNANEDYIEADMQISDEILKLFNSDDRFYRFEGYQIFQVIGPEVGANDLENPSLARIIRQYDVINFDQNGNPIGALINWEFDDLMQISVPKLKVEGSNLGIEHSFEVTQDIFATGNRQLVNYKTYYFIAVAYAYNQYYPYSVKYDDAPNGLLGQQKPYLRGRKTYDGRSVTPVQAIPHPPSLHGGGLTLNCDYGSIPVITRLDGQGNGGVALELSQETIDKIMSGGDNGDYKVRELIYKKNAGPLNVRIVDPLRVKPFDYTLVIRDSIFEKEGIDPKILNNMEVSNDAYWVLTIDNTITDDQLKEAGLIDKDDAPIREFYAQQTIANKFEQIIFPLGIAISVHNKDFMNYQPNVLKYWDRITTEYTNVTDITRRLYKAKLMFCQSEKIEIKNDIIFANNGPQWIIGLKDDNGTLPSNWIRSGTTNLGIWNSSNSATKTVVFNDYSLWRQEDACIISNLIVPPPGDPHNSLVSDRAYKDYTGKFGTLCGGTWAPYVLTSPYDNCPQAKYVLPEPQYKSDGTPDEPRPAYYAFQGITTDPPETQPGYNQTMTNLYSVDIVITPDKDKWTRCIVLESCPDRTKSEGGALKNEPRKAISRDKNGNPENNATDGFGPTGNQGMSWFPGYAINIETGERLNIMFSENSDSTLNKFTDLVNGRDMVFNPTSTYAIATKDLFIKEEGIYLPEGYVIPKSYYDYLYSRHDNALGYLKSLGIERVWGGMHYVYVCNSSGNTSPIYYLNKQVIGGSAFMANPRRNFNLNDTILKLATFLKGVGGYIDENIYGKKYPCWDGGPYDKCQWLVAKYKQALKPGLKEVEYRNYKMQLFNQVMYTHIPLQPEEVALKNEWMSCDVTYKIRVTRPYQRYISRWFESPELRDEAYSVPKEHDNHGYPVYKLSTRELAPTFNDTRVFQSILDKINIVPNPYYGGSFYEKNALDTKVKITNLPTGLYQDLPAGSDQKSKTILGLKNDAPITINIFTVNGILVRTLTKGDPQTTYVDWDLKNHANIPIAGGVYIIHVNCPGIGERMLKFFCNMRPTDLNTF